jgi:hypothetical protein
MKPTIIESIDALIKIAKKFKSLSHTLGNFGWHDYTPDISVSIRKETEAWEVTMFNTVEIIYNDKKDYEISITPYTDQTPQKLADIVLMADGILGKIINSVNSDK